MKFANKYDSYRINGYLVTLERSIDGSCWFICVFHSVTSPLNPTGKAVLGVTKTKAEAQRELIENQAELLAKAGLKNVG
jgi:hypothetical protein